VPNALSSSEAAHHLRLPAETIRYWERAGLLAPVGRDYGGRRRYSDADLEFLDVIRCLRLTGMPIRQVRQFSDLVRQGPSTARERLALLRSHRAEVLASIRAQQDALGVIEDKITRYQEMVQTS